MNDSIRAVDVADVADQISRSLLHLLSVMNEHPDLPERTLRHVTSIAGGVDVLRSMSEPSNV